jgi:hypothetical protein
MPRYTLHAEKCVQQRAVPPIVIDWLMAYGARAPAGAGSERLYFDKNGRRRRLRFLGLYEA